MRRALRALLVVPTILPLATAATPAVAASGPVAVHDHVSVVPQVVQSVSSSAAGTVFTAADGRTRLVRGALAPGAPSVDLGRPSLPAWYPHHRVTLTGTRVVMPRTATGYHVTSVAWCVVDACPAMTTYTPPDGHVYLGNGDDVAVLHAAATNSVVLAPWSGGDPTVVPLGDLPAPAAAFADATGVALWGISSAAYLNRTTLALTPLPGGEPYLTPSYVYFSAAANGQYDVRRVPRATPGSAPTVEWQTPNRPMWLSATDGGAAWSVNLGNAESYPLVTAAVGGAPTPAGSVFTFWFGAAADGDRFLAYQQRAAGRSIYAIAPGSETAAPAYDVPPIPAPTVSLSLSHGHAAWADHSTYQGSAFLRALDGAAPGPESPLGPTRTVALSGPYHARLVQTATAGTVGVAFGRPARKPGYVTVPGDMSSRLVASGRRLVVTHGFRSTLVDMEARTVQDLGQVVATVDGDVVVTADATGRVARRHVVTGAVQVVRAGTPGACGTGCTPDRWRLAAWGDDVVYALALGPDRVAGLWSAGTTTPLPMLDGGWTHLTYRDGLLLTGPAGGGVHLYDVRAATHHVVDDAGLLLPGTALDGKLLGWHSSALFGRPGVQPVADFLPAYAPTPRHLNAVVPASFLTPSPWAPTWFVSDDVAWRLDIRQDGATGPVVRTLTGTSVRGEVAPRWDGTTATGSAAPHGRYTWVLSGGVPTRSGTVFLSRDTPPRPTVRAPELVSDVSADSTFPVSWSGAPAGTRYRVERRIDGAPWLSLGTTTARSMTVTARQGNTFRFRVAIVDQAGRTGPATTATTVSPADDHTGRPDTPSVWVRQYGARYWRGSHVTTARAEQAIEFTGGWTDGIYVVGTKGPRYGRYRVTVDSAAGRRTWTYDAYAPTVRYRQVLFRLRVPTGGHTVRLEALPTAGRTRIGVDGVGFRYPLL